MVPRGIIVAIAVLLLLSEAGLSKQENKDCWKAANTQMQMNQCADQDARQADAELNKAYQELLAKATGNDRALAKLRAAQDAWLAFRDAELGAIFPAENQQASYGSMFPMCFAKIAAEMTKNRTAQLRRMIEHWGQDGPGCVY